MKCAHGLTMIVGLTLAVGELYSQGIANSNPAGRGFGYGGSFYRSSRSRTFGLSAYYGGTFGYGYPSSFSSITVLQSYAPPTIIIIMPRESLARDRDRDDRPPEGVVRIRPRREREKEPEREKEKEAKPLEPQPELIPPPHPFEQLRPRPKPPPPPHVEPPKDPLAESARHLEIGKEAFTFGEYGRAAFRFRKAAESAPNQALPHFLLAQALLALGKYRDAVGAIHSGLALDPTWPALGLRLRALYGPDNDEFAWHFQQLSAARAVQPDDPVLLFLQAYVLWFDGRQDDARPLLERAAPLVPDRKDIDRFLQAP